MLQRYSQQLLFDNHLPVQCQSYPNPGAKLAKTGSAINNNMHDCDDQGVNSLWHCICIEKSQKKYRQYWISFPNYEFMFVFQSFQHVHYHRH